MPDQGSAVLSGPLIMDRKADQFAAYPEDIMRDVYTGKVDPGNAGTFVLGMFELWVNGMTHGAAKFMREYGGRNV